MSVFQSFYVSRATDAFDHASIQSMLQGAQRSNAGLRITGCLLFSGRCFAQVLEGDEAAVTALTQRIATDPRHTDLRLLSKTRRAEREYADWITEAKRAETKEKRITQAIEWIAEGKQRNWKYQNC